MCAIMRKIGYKVTHYYIKKRKNKHIIIVFYEIILCCACLFVSLPYK